MWPVNQTVFTEGCLYCLSSASCVSHWSKQLNCYMLIYTIRWLKCNHKEEHVNCRVEDGFRVRGHRTLGADAVFKTFTSPLYTLLQQLWLCVVYNGSSFASALEWFLLTHIINAGILVVISNDMVKHLTIRDSGNHGAVGRTVCSSLWTPGLVVGFPGFPDSWQQVRVSKHRVGLIWTRSGGTQITCLWIKWRNKVLFLFTDRILKSGV